MEDFDEDETGRSPCARSSTWRFARSAKRCSGSPRRRRAGTPSAGSASYLARRGRACTRASARGVSRPLRAKDLAPNHAQANVVAAIDALAPYPVDASVREGDASREPESHTPGDPRESNLVGDTNDDDDDYDGDRRSKRAKTSSPASPAAAAHPRALSRARPADSPDRRFRRVIRAR